MENPLLSIIVPVYNVEKYLDQCISSIINQTYKNIEIILVNDGSTDSSGEICKKYAEKDSRIRLLSQKNQGLTRARKNGAALVTGEYLAFVDADDYLEPNLFQQYMELEVPFDLAIANWFREEERRSIPSGDGIAYGFYSSEADMDFIYRHLVSAFTTGGLASLKSGFVPFVWNKLFKSDIAKSVFSEVCEEITLVEDCDFTYRYFLKCKSVFVTDICGYHYRIRKSSACHAVDTQGTLLINVSRLYRSLLPEFTAHRKSSILVPQLQEKIAALIRRAPKRMGFPLEAQNRSFVFPFLNMLTGKQIALYGAGFLGKIYWKQIRQWNVCDVVIWVDEYFEEYMREGLPVFPTEGLKSEKFDFIIIASFEEASANQIQESLVDAGYSSERILWKRPLEP